MKYGYIGLGNLGGHLAVSLVRAGFDVTVYDKNPALAERPLALGAHWADSPAQLAAEVDAVFTCLPSPVVSALVLQELIAAGKPGLHWLEMSTLGRDEIQALAQQAKAAGIQVLESPVTGGVHLAAQGKITVIVGGEQTLFEQHQAAFAAMGDKIFYMGALGSAAIIKVITNMLAFIHLVADGEALMLAKRGGLDLAQAWAVIKASSGNSFVHETEGQLILNGSYDIAFTMDLALKDLGFALNFGREFGVPLDLASLTQQTFLTGKAAYGGQAQSTQIVKLLEDALQTDLRAAGFPSRLE
ncbi:MAG: NAD(P)-dependent oxidoreductase [Thiolinea sp.]